MDRIQPRLIVFTDSARADPALSIERFTRLGARALSRSVLFVLRDYAMALRERFAFGQRLSALATSTGQRFGVAERADLARALSCTAFHLPAGGLAAADARDFLGPEVFLSRGTHELTLAPEPELVPEPELDALLLSPIFEARKGRPALGPEGLTRASRLRTKPSLFALGGVSAENAAVCLGSGATGVAVIGAALEPDPEPLLEALGILRR